jgi:vacuolar-type H+-ATPase subunit E/Vma4
MSAEDIATVLSAVGDSWPAAVVVVALVAAFIAVRALPRLKEITDALGVLRHEMKPNSGKTIRDAVDRIEKRVTEVSDSLDAHIVESKARAEADDQWRGQVEDLLTQGPPPPPGASGRG